MKMRVNIFSCLLAFIMGCNVTAGLIHEVVEEKEPVSLRCPRPVEGKVTWSRGIRGSKVDILSADGDGQERLNDPSRRYNSLADKFRSLYISRTNVSDSGRYLCNNEPAVELTVIPSGTTRLTAEVRTDITLTCPADVSGSHLPTWTRQNSDRKFSENQMGQTLTITDVQSDDSGLYYCDGKPAAYLTVQDDQSKRAAPGLVFTLEVLLPLLLFITSITLLLFWRCKNKRRGSGDQQAETVYAEISDGSVFEPTQGGSDQHSYMYSIIHEAPALENNSEISQGAIYSLINKPN